MRKKPPILAVLAMALTLAMFASACGGSDDDAASSSADEPTESTSSATEPAEDDAMEDDEDHDDEDESDEVMTDQAMTDGEPTILRVGLQFGPDSGLAIESDDASVLVKAGVVESLVRADASGQPVPELAESWERIDDTTWQFALRPGVVFHDGSTLDAAAVETALSYISGVASPPRALGGLALTTEIVDDLTVNVITSDPDPILPLRLSARSMSILAPAAYDVTPTAPIGTGPFQLTDFAPPDSLTVERFDGYWGEPGQVDGAVFRFIPDAGARAAAIRADEVDVVSGIALADLDAVGDDPDIELFRLSLPRTASLYANTVSGPMSDPVVREAVSLAIDQVTMAEDLLEGQFAPAFGYFGTENTWAPQSDPNPADAIEQAAALVESLDDSSRSLQIWTYGSRPELADMATVAQAQLQAVGFNVELEVGEYTPLEERVFNGEHDMFLLSRGYYFDIADAGAVLSSDFGCEGGYNLNLYCNEDFDAILDDLTGADSTAARQELFGQAVNILADENVGIPLVHDRARYAFRTDVMGFDIDPFESILLTSQVSLG
jgi:peptide/nickel transport system substrate-binding protein